LTIEISSHTDSRGNDAYNLALSQKRAEAVVDYLVKQGVDKTNIVAKGYGESRLINRCSDDVDCTAAEHQENRRTEVKVIENVKVNDNDKLYNLKDKEKININSFPKDFFNYCQ
jgi:outer membrane protein OmpA-like peptidoglycan-associated protein